MTAIYARQSVDKKDSLSIDGQIELCRRRAEGEIKVYADRGYSGKNTKRPAFAALMQDVDAGAVQRILVYRLDRFSRSISDFSRLWDTLERRGVAFQSVTENFDTSTPIGRAMLNIVLVFAQLERETTAERVRDNYFHRVELGAWPGGPAPFGFSLRRIQTPERQVSSLRSNEDADIVVQIFQTYACSDISLRALAKELTARGLQSPKRGAWDNVTLSRLLRSPLYVRATPEVLEYYLSRGTRCIQPPEAFDGIHGCNVVGRRKRGNENCTAPPQLTLCNHDGLIDAALWLSVQEKLDRGRQLSRVNAGQYSWLTGLMKCGKCGYAVKINYRASEQRHYLLCSGRSNLSLCDAAIRVDLRELENAAESQICRMLRETRTMSAPSLPQETARQLLEIDRKIERLLRVLAESGDIAGAYITGEIRRLHEERCALESAPGRAGWGTSAADFSGLSFAEKKLAAAELIDRVELLNDEAVFYWKI